MNTCANCGGIIGNLETPYVWRGSTVCAACHARLARLPAPITPGTSPVHCPQCRSTHVARLPAVYEQGTSRTHGQHLSFALTGDDIVPIIGASSGGSTSLLAQRLGPPSRANRATRFRATAMAPGILVGLAFMVFTSANSERGLDSDRVGLLIEKVLCLMAVWIVVVLVATWKKARALDAEDERAYLAALSMWRNTWYCYQCGHTFLGGE